MTELQKIEFEMLKEAVRICDELKLRYYLVCGSALGAVKYGGFIPWDDDVDIGLPREDYEIFLSKAQDMLPQHIFLQNRKTDPKYPHIFSKLRDCDTTFFEKSVADFDINHGVYIDVFPLDGYPSDIAQQRILEKEKVSCQKKLSCVFDLPRNFKATLGMLLRRACGYRRRTASIVDRYTAAISRYSTHDSDIICNHGNWQGRLEYAAREQYGDGVMVSFEGLRVRVPARYDEYLTQKYGDWRADLPEERKVGHHYAALIDLKHPYTDYAVKTSNGKILIKQPKKR